MTKHTGTEAEMPLLGAEWFDPLEAKVRQQIRRFIEEMLEEEVAAALQRGRYERVDGAAGYRNGHRDRQLVGTFGPVSVLVPGGATNTPMIGDAAEVSGRRVAA